jgi:hypothetical protein
MKKGIILHPFLFAILPVLFLYSHNIGQLSLPDLTWPLILAAAASLLLWWLLGLALRDRLRAALFASLFWVWFFSYGHLQIMLTPEYCARQGIGFAGAWYFLAIYFSLLLGGIAVLMLWRGGLHTLSSALNLAAAVLVAWHLFSIGEYEIKRSLTSRRLQQAPALAQPQPQTAQRPPNIYYIILDGYARADVLQEIYQFDNRDFLHYLAEKGFHVASKGKANYCQTALSLASSLNFTYLDDLAAQIDLNTDDRRPVRQMISENRLYEFLRRRGYRIVGFPTIYRPVQPLTADVFITKGQITGFNEFQECIIAATPILLFIQTPENVPSNLRGILGVSKNITSIHTKTLLFTCEYLPDTADLEPPIFVFAHIMCPHPPFLFDRRGNRVRAKMAAHDPLADGSHLPISRQDYIQGYTEQVLFINSKLRTLIDKILAESEQPPVIILQADHGPGSLLEWENPEKTCMKERFGILLAYYLPGGDMPARDDLSAVNIFRLVLKHCFGANLELLPDECYYSTWSRPYRFLRVTDKVEKETNLGP